MPPRTRTQTPTARRPRVAGMRDPRRLEDATDEPTDLDPADDDTSSAATQDATEDAPEAAATPGPTDAAATTPEDESPTGATTPGATTPGTTSGATTPGTTPATPNGATSRADTSAGPEGAATRTAAPTPAARPTPTGPNGAERSPNRRRPAVGAAGTATLERPAARPAPEPSGGDERPGRLARLGGALGRFGSSRAMPVVLVVVIVVCAALAGLGAWLGHREWTEGPVANQAVIDVGGTAELVGQSRQAVEQVFSYDPAKLDESANAARAQATEPFLGQYLEVFDRAIRGPATQQQLRQTATVLNIGAQEMTGDTARVMALVQFNAERASTGQTTNAPGLLALDMKRIDGRWKLAQIQPLTATP